MGNANLHTVEAGPDVLPSELRVGLNDSVDQGTHRSSHWFVSPAPQDFKCVFVHTLDSQVATGI